MAFIPLEPPRRRALVAPVTLALAALSASCSGSVADGMSEPASSVGPDAPPFADAPPVLGAPMTGAEMSSNGVPLPGSSAPGVNDPTVVPAVTGGVGAAPVSTTETSPPGPVVATACDALTTRRLRRISVREYANVVSDVLGPEFAPVVLDALPAEARSGGFDHQDSAFVSPSFFENVADLAASVAGQVDAATLAPCAVPEGSSECLQSFMTDLGARAFGRPPNEAELTRMQTVADTGEGYAGSVRVVVEYLLQAPQFLYLSELGAEDTPAVSGQTLSLTPYELASQLSFMLRGSRPDAELLQAAAAGFASPDALRAQVQRLLADARAQRELTRFVWGWFDMEPLVDAPKSMDAFPEWSPELVTAMQQEFDAFVSASIGPDGTIGGFMSRASADVPSALAPIYGEALRADSTVDPSLRLGLLSLPAVLAYHSSYQHSGPVERGLFVRRQLLCQDVPPPPQAVLQRLSENPIPYDDLTLTTRQKFEVHLDDPSCSACHQLFDPIGFGLEEMDGIGRFRTVENGLPIDSTGALAGTDIDGPFEGVAELSDKLAQSKVFEACAVEHFFRFAQSRSAEPSDACLVDAWTAALDAAGGRIQDLVLTYTADNAFSQRRDDR